MTDIAVAHWEQPQMGGGERVAWELARAFDTECYVGAKTSDCEPDDVEVVDMFADTLGGRAIRRGGLPGLVAAQLAWERPDPLAEREVVITSGNEPLTFVPSEETTWVHYAHHTGRWATDLLDTSMSAPGRLYAKAHRVLQRSYAQKPDLVVANSALVAERLATYWGVGRERIRVVHPPVDIDRYSPDKLVTANYHLSLCRLDGHKRVDDVIDAYRRLDVPLKIAGDGPERPRLERKARGVKNVELLGFVSEDRKRDLLSGAEAMVVNAEREDFGIATVEALAAGTPVIGVAEGMTDFLVRDGETGISYERGELRKAVRRMRTRGVARSERAIAQWAEQFRPERFHEEMRAVVAEAKERTRVNPDLKPVPTDPEMSERNDQVVADGGARQR